MQILVINNKGGGGRLLVFFLRLSLQGWDAEVGLGRLSLAPRRTATFLLCSSPFGLHMEKAQSREASLTSA